VFKVNTNGTGFATLLWFNSSDVGANPGAGLCLSGVTLYGTTYNGGSFGKGTVFKVNTDGTGSAVLKNFNGPDGASAFASLTLVHSRLYGTTRDGGDYGLGTVFSLGLPPQLGGAYQDGGGGFALTVMGEPERRCELYSTTNFIDWELLTTLTNETGTAVYTDWQATNLLARFYRVLQLP